jgi:2-isopropylmalate synthase
LFCVRNSRSCRVPNLTIALGNKATGRATYVEAKLNSQTHWGAAIDTDLTTASLKALVSAVNRAI